MQRSSLVVLCFISSVVSTAYGADLTLTQSGRVTIELVTSNAAFHNTLSLTSPTTATVNITGCALEPSTGLPGLRLLSEKTSQHGCRVELDSDPGTPGIQGFAAGTTLSFSMCAQTNADPACEYVWSSDPTQNSDNFDHVITQDLFPGNFPGRVMQLRWEDLPNGGDNDFNDLIANVRVSLDSDGDGLWDDWEMFGIDTDGDGVVDYTIPDNPNPNHKDMYLEIDFMDCAMAGGDCAVGDNHTHRPNAAAVAGVVQAFANAPITNPDNLNGITLHVDVSNSIPHQNALIIQGLCFGANPSIGDFDAVKANPANFGTNNPRRFVYRYGLFTHNQIATSSSSGCGELPGNDFQVSLGSWANSTGTVQDQADTLMHEFGHNLNLQHGGNVGTNRKPNYVSIMSYAYQGRNGIPPTDPDGAGPLVGRVDYSPAVLPALNESNLNEATAIGAGTDTPRYFCLIGGVNTLRTAPGNGPVDWNCDNDTNDNNVVEDINNDGVFSVLTGFDDWANIKYDFQNAGDFDDGQHNFSTRVVEIDYVTASRPFADAGAIADGNPKTPPGPPYEVYHCDLGSSATLDGSGSYDRNGTIDVYSWNYGSAGGGAGVQIGVKPVFDCSYEVGDVPVALSVKDYDGLTDSDDATIQIAVNAGSDIAAECSGHTGTAVSLGGGLPNSATLSYQWTDENGNLIGSQAQVSPTVPLGTHDYTVTVTDARGEQRSDSVKVTIVDTVPPSMSLNLSPDILWPPNHKMRDISAAISVSDGCDPNPQVKLVSVVSNEPDNGAGDGNTVNDIQNTDIGSDDRSFSLRAERSGTGTGRVYTVTYSVTDGSGNQSTKQGTVAVPLSQ